MKAKVKSLSLVQLFVIPWIVAHAISQQEYCGLPFPSPGDLPDPGIKSRTPTLQAEALPLSHQGRWAYINTNTIPWNHSWTLLAVGTVSWLRDVTTVMGNNVSEEKATESCFPNQSHQNQRLFLNWFVFSVLFPSRFLLSVWVRNCRGSQSDSLKGTTLRKKVRWFYCILGW